MKQENTRKSKLWLWLVLGVVLLAVAGTVLAFVLGGPGANAEGKTDRAALYWNVDRQIYLEGSETGLSTRRPGEDGTYRVRFAYEGEIKEYVVADRKLINKIDFNDVMGLEFDADGTIINVIDATNLAVSIGKVNYVRRVDGNTVKANSSIAMNGMEFDLVITDKTRIYDVRQGIENPGQIIDASKLEVFANIIVFANEQEEVTHIYLTALEKDVEIYWRAEQMWDSSKQRTTRVPDGDGYYSIEFCHNGGLVTLKTKDDSVVNYIDNKSRYGPHFCFNFDENGNIIEVLPSSAGTYGVLVCQRAVVKSVEGGVITAKTEIVGDDGSTYEITLPENSIIYDASSVARREGRQGQAVDSLKIGDIISVWSDTEGVPVLTYIAQRFTDAPAFFNPIRYYDYTNKVSTREPNEKGWYEFEMVKVGSIGKVIVKTKDKTLADFIDGDSTRVLGLRLDGNVIVQAYDGPSVYGMGVYGAGSVVNEYNGVTASVMSFGKPEGALSFVLSSDCKFYDISGVGKYGQETEMRLGDIVFAQRQLTGEIIAVFITRRVVGGDKLYYNPYYQYDSKNQETSRVPDEDGYYVFELFNQGKMVTVKTKDKELASKMDSTSGDLTMALEVKNGIATKIYESAWTYSQRLYSGWRVRKINDNGTVLIGNSVGNEYTLKLAEKCKIWNVSSDYDTALGEKTKLRVGDMVVPFADMYSEVQEILVRRRYVDHLAWKLERQYDSKTKETLRTPDADGYYSFEMAVNGKIRTLKTKNKDLANRVEAVDGPMGLRLSGDVIKSVVDVSWMRDTQGANWNQWDITKIKGSEITAEFTKPGYSYTGNTETRKLASNVKIYDFSPSAKQFGEVSKVKVGDRVRAQTDREGNLLYVMILDRDTRVKGSVGYCSHCDKEVRWHPWSGIAWDGVDCHYYLSGDITLDKQTNVGNEKIDYEVVLDLNGKDLTVIGARAFLVWRGDELTILDSVGGGSVSATGSAGANGGLSMLTGGATMNLLAGTYSFIPSDRGVSRGGISYVVGESVLNIDGAVINGGNLVGADNAVGGALAINGSECNFYSGIISGGSVTATTEYTEGANLYTQGGNVYVVSGTFNMYDGVISGGKVNISQDQAGQGANIYALRSQVNILGGKVVDGVSQQHGGNIFLSTSDLTAKNTTISGGTVTGGNGSGLYCQNKCLVELVNSTLEGSVHCQKDATIKVDNSTLDGSIYMNYEGAGLIMNNATMTGDLKLLNATTVVASGKTTIAKGNSTGIMLGDNVLMDVSGLTAGAKLVIDKDGVFTTELTNPASYTDYFESIKSFTSAQVKGNALAMQKDTTQLNKLHEVAEKMTADGVFNAGGTITAECPYCGESVQWEPLNAADSATQLQGQHYYLASDLTSNKGYYDVKGNTCLHLNGHNITSSTRVFYQEDYEMTIMGSGVVTGAANKATTGAVDVANGSMNLFGGIFTSSSDGNIFAVRGNNISNAVNMYEGATILRDATTVQGAGVYVVFDGDFNIYGGLVTGGTRGGNGGNFQIVSGSSANQTATLNVYGGTIEKGTATLGGNIYVSGATASVNFYGGKVSEGSVYTRSTVSTMVISGEPEIELLDLTEGTKLVLGELTGNASVNVVANGVFTDELGNPEAYLNYLHAANADSQIEVQGQTLAVTKKPVFDLNDVHTLAEKMTADGVFNAGGTVTAECPYCHESVQWEPLNAAVGNVALNGEKHYYLASDLTSNTGFYEVKGNTCLHLNGHNITSSARLFYNEGVVLNIMGEGTLTGVANKSTTGAMDIAGGILNLFGGTYTSPNRNIIAARGDVGHAVNMYEGASIVKNANATTGYAVEVRWNGTFNLHGGEVTGDIHVGGTQVSVNFYGGKVDGSVLTEGAVQDIIVSGAPEIKLLSLSSGTKLALGELTGNASITVAADGVFAENLQNPDAYLPYLTCGVAGHHIEAQGNALIVVSDNITNIFNTIHTQADKMTADGVFNAGGTVTAKCPYCGVDAQWEPLTAANANSDLEDQMHYYLSSDLTGNTTPYVTKGYSCVHLNGHNITSADRAFFVQSGTTLNIMGAGRVTGAAAVSNNGAMDVLGALNLFGGTFTASNDYNIVSMRGDTAEGATINMYEGATLLRDNTTVAGAGVYVYANSAFNLYGGCISGGSRSSNGGNFQIVQSGNTSFFARLNVYDGIIEKGTAGGLGGNIYASGVRCSVNFYGGIVREGSVYTRGTVTAIKISGAPQIELIDLTDRSSNSSGTKLELGDLTTGAQINVVALDGVFTTTHANAADYTAFIKAATAGKQVTADNNALVMGNA